MTKNRVFEVKMTFWVVSKGSIIDVFLLWICPVLLPLAEARWNSARKYGYYML